MHHKKVLWSCGPARNGPPGASHSLFLTPFPDTATSKVKMPNEMMHRRGPAAIEIPRYQGQPRDP